MCRESNNENENLGIAISLALPAAFVLSSPSLSYAGNAEVALDMATLDVTCASPAAANPAVAPQDVRGCVEALVNAWNACKRMTTMTMVVRPLLLPVPQEDPAWSQ